MPRTRALAAQSGRHGDGGIPRLGGRGRTRPSALSRRRTWPAWSSGRRSSEGSSPCLPSATGSPASAQRAPTWSHAQTASPAYSPGHKGSLWHRESTSSPPAVPPTITDPEHAPMMSSGFRYHRLPCQRRRARARAGDDLRCFQELVPLDPGHDLDLHALEWKELVLVLVQDDLRDDGLLLAAVQAAEQVGDGHVG